MTKFEIRTDSFQFRFGTYRDSIPEMTAQEVFDEYLTGSANDPEWKESFDTLEEARECFRRYYANYGSAYAEKGNTFWILRGDVAWIEENEYDEDGEFDQGGEIYDLSAAPYVKGE